MTNDIDELTALNCDFVGSARNSDVGRFDEILRRSSIAQIPTNRWSTAPPSLSRTAKPVATKNLRGARGDFAIIHAATTYTTPDGQQAHGRYTDCGAKQNGN